MCVGSAELRGDSQTGFLPERFTAASADALSKKNQILSPVKPFKTNLLLKMTPPTHTPTPPHTALIWSIGARPAPHTPPCPTTEAQCIVNTARNPHVHCGYHNVQLHWPRGKKVHNERL